MPYRVFHDEASDTSVLPESPSTIWIISTLEICIRSSYGSFLILMYPSYPLYNQANAPGHDEGYWAPPFVAYPVPMADSPPTRLGSLRRLCEQTLSSIPIGLDLAHLAYQMGLRDVVH